MRSALALAAAGAVLTIGTTTVAATAAPSDARSASTCPNTRTYLDGLSATVHHGVLKITGHPTKFVCKHDAEYYQRGKKTETFTVVKGASLRVFKKPYLSPDQTRPITAAKFPHYLAHQRGEPYYRYFGPRTAITKLRPAFAS